MASRHPSGFKVPVRPAPAPPPGVTKGTPNLMDSWDLSFDDPFSDAFSKQGSHQSTAWPDMQNTKKKIPPPRPPPPKISVTGKPNTKLKPKPSTKATRPTELITSLFSRRGQKAESTLPQGPLGISNKSVTPTSMPVSSNVATASLIDLSSPSSSPTPTTRSSSDGLSVDSFGSDGTACHSHHHSQVESGFEDDSELFGGFTATPSPVSRDPWASSPSTPSDVFLPLNSTATSKNPWASVTQDPFSPPRRFTASPTPAATPSVLSCTTSYLPASMPTIIRPRVKPNSSPSITRAKSSVSPSLNSIDDGDDRSESPPMPSIPPPAPPPELLKDSSSFGKGSRTQDPHCIALYDYESPHADDLPFKEGDTIELLKELSDDWLQGRIGNRVGMFPSNFVKIVVPPSHTGGVFATALYNFIPETWEDLDLQEGAKVQLLSRINNDWLYGECNGKRGQFPSTFVDNVPANLPKHS